MTETIAVRNKVYHLNIGGEKFHVLGRNLAKFPNSLLTEALIDNKMEFNYSDAMNPVQYYFDRNPQYFSYVLDYYRTGELTISSPKTMSERGEMADLVSGENGSGKSNLKNFLAYSVHLLQDEFIYWKIFPLILFPPMDSTNHDIEEYLLCFVGSHLFHSFNAIGFESVGPMSPLPPDPSTLDSSSASSKRFVNSLIDKIKTSVTESNPPSASSKRFVNLFLSHHSSELFEIILPEDYPKTIDHISDDAAIRRDLSATIPRKRSKMEFEETKRRYDSHPQELKDARKEIMKMLERIGYEYLFPLRTISVFPAQDWLNEVGERFQGRSVHAFHPYIFEFYTITQRLIGNFIDESDILMPQLRGLVSSYHWIHTNECDYDPIIEKPQLEFAALLSLNLISGAELFDNFQDAQGTIPSTGLVDIIHTFDPSLMPPPNEDISNEPRAISIKKKSQVQLQSVLDPNYKNKISRCNYAVHFLAKKGIKAQWVSTNLATFHLDNLRSMPEFTPYPLVSSLPTYGCKRCLFYHYNADPFHPYSSSFPPYSDPRHYVRNELSYECSCSVRYLQFSF